LRAPITFIHGNCVFARGLRDAWAAFAIEPSSYGWLNDEEKRARLAAIAGAIESVGADFQFLRISVQWEAEQYGEELRAEAREQTRGVAVREPAWGRYVDAHIRHLGNSASADARVFLLVSLRDPGLNVDAFLSGDGDSRLGGLRSKLSEARAVGARRMMTARELQQTRARADQVQARAAAFLDVREVRGVELQWLVRRAFCRGLGEPVVDGLHEPRALAFERNGHAVLAPLEGDVMRWAEGCVEHRGRSLRIESEVGTSWQAQLVVGALPERVQFPSAAAELMFAPSESLPFGIDLSLNGRYLANDLALRMARRRVQDADQIMRAEQDGEQGVTDLGFQRTQQARDLLSHLQASRKPPLIRATLAVAVAAPRESELERRVEMCRRAFGETRLHRPHGEQLRLFVQHLPAQRTQVAGYDDMLTTEQIGAMVPTASHSVGSGRGFYLGHTLTGSRHPVRFNLREGSDTDSNVTILSVGALGSGKTTLAQKLQYEAFLQGARVVDCDPKGDHRFHLLEDVAPHVECVDLRPHHSLRGMLDPLRIAPPHLAQDATVSFLRSLLPARAEAAWETAIVAAVDRVITGSREPTCLEVVRVLKDEGGVGGAVGATLEVYARSGLTQLGFSDPGVRLPPVGTQQVTYLPIRDLPGPPQDARRSEYSQAERSGEQIVRLIAMLAMHLMGAERERLKVFSFDEGWRLLGDPVGRALLGSLQRMGRSELAVPIISTQLVTDALVGERASLESLVGATFVFGMRSDAEAARALLLLGLDPQDRRLRRSLIEMQAGRCLFRDHVGRVAAIQVDLVLPSLLRAFSTTPAS
jgi:hypothetical protein